MIFNSGNRGVCVVFVCVCVCVGGGARSLEYRYYGKVTLNRFSISILIFNQYIDIFDNSNCDLPNKGSVSIAP